MTARVVFYGFLLREQHLNGVGIANQLNRQVVKLQLYLYCSTWVGGWRSRDLPN